MNFFVRSDYLRIRRATQDNLYNAIVADVTKHLTDSYQLQQEFEESMRQADFIIHDENARRLQLRILILEEDNEKLHIQIDEEHDRMYSLEDERDQLLKDVQYADEKALGFEEEVRSRTKELNSLKVCMPWFSFFD